MTTHELEPLLKQDEVCNRLKISTRTFYRLVNSRRLPALKIGRVWRIKASDLHKIISRGTRSPKVEETGITENEIEKILENISRGRVARIEGSKLELTNALKEIETAAHQQALLVSMREEAGHLYVWIEEPSLSSSASR